MRTLFVVVREPRPQRLPRFVQRLEVVKPEALLFYRPNQTLDHTVLLRGMGSDELLFQTILVHRAGVVPGCKHQAIVATQGNRIPSPAQGAIPSNEGLLQGCFSRFGVATGTEPPTQRLAGMAIHDDRQGTPAVNGATPDPRDVG